MTDESEKELVPAGPDDRSKIKPPPHPLDQRWYTHQNDQVYGPYTGHELKTFAADGIVDSSTNVVREGQETWVKAGEDPVLARIFRVERPLAPPPAITAGKGATIVQVTNQIGATPVLGYLDDEPFGPKSAGVALLLSFLLCGAGQMYNGQVVKGILMLVGCILLWSVFLGWIINLWSWIDAYQTAKKMNARYKRRLASGLPI
jgi:hypothetical protein